MRVLRRIFEAGGKCIMGSFMISTPCLILHDQMEGDEMDRA
jgi:hypothetical protein